MDMEVVHGLPSCGSRIEADIESIRVAFIDELLSHSINKIKDCQSLFNGGSPPVTDRSFGYNKGVAGAHLVSITYGKS